MKVIKNLLSAALLLAVNVAFAHQADHDESSVIFNADVVDSDLSSELWLGGVLQSQAGEGRHHLGEETEANYDGQVTSDVHRNLIRNRYLGCDVLKVWIRKSDIQRAALTMDNGYSFQVPFYEKGNNRQKGVWYEQLTYANKQQNMGSGLVTLKFNLNSSLAMSVVAGQKQLAILGGTGQLGACPAGYGMVTGDQADVVQFEFTVCDSCS